EIEQVTFDRLFDVQPLGSLTLTDVHLDFGFLTDVATSGAGDGAGIRSQGTLTVRRAWFSDMHASADMTRNGGGLAVNGGSATVTDSLFTDMQVEDGAGQAAAVTAGSRTLQNGTATGNAVATGGVFAALAGATLTVRGATVLENAAAAVDRVGGGTLKNVTIALTLAGGSGGACTSDDAVGVQLLAGNV